MHSDPISDLLTRIRNAVNVRHTYLEVPLSKIKLEIVKILQAEGFIENHEISTGSKFPNLRIKPKYDTTNQPVIKHLKRISTPGLRVYQSSTDIKPIRNGLGTRVVSTSQGLLTDREARKRRIGGEIICEVW